MERMFTCEEILVTVKYILPVGSRSLYLSRGVALTSPDLFPSCLLFPYYVLPTVPTEHHLVNIASVRSA